MWTKEWRWFWRKPHEFGDRVFLLFKFLNCHKHFVFCCIILLIFVKWFLFIFYCFCGVGFLFSGSCFAAFMMANGARSHSPCPVVVLPKRWLFHLKMGCQNTIHLFQCLTKGYFNFSDFIINLDFVFKLLLFHGRDWVHL